MNHRLPHPELYDVPYDTDSFCGMPYRNVGRSGLQISVVGLGTWKFGYPETGDTSRVDEQTALQLLDKACELGVTHWDTANRYNKASGNSERIIGTWFKSNEDQRRNIVLATKLRGGMDGTTPNHGGLSRGAIRDALAASLERLQVEYVDLLYFHLYDEQTPPEESLSAIEDLVQSGQVRYFGVSNYPVDIITVYKKIEESTSLRCRIAAIQNRFDIMHGETIPGVRECAAQAGIGYIPHSPLATGLLTDKYLERSKVSAGDRLFDEQKLERVAAKPVMEKVRALAHLAKEWEMPLNQLVLAYTLAIPGITSVIPSASNIDQLASNARAGKISLSLDQQEKTKEIVSNVTVKAD